MSLTTSSDAVLRPASWLAYGSQASWQPSGVCGTSGAVLLVGYVCEVLVPVMSVSGGGFAMRGKLPR